MESSVAKGVPPLCGVLVQIAILDPEGEKVYEYSRCVGSFYVDRVVLPVLGV